MDHYVREQERFWNSLKGKNSQSWMKVHRRLMITRQIRDDFARVVEYEELKGKTLDRSSLPGL